MWLIFFLLVAAWIDKVEAAVNTIVLNIWSIETRLIFIILVILLIDEVNDWLPAACVYENKTKNNSIMLAFLIITSTSMKPCQYTLATCYWTDVCC